MILIHNEQQLKKEVRQWYLAVRFSLGYKTKRDQSDVRYNIEIRLCTNFW